MKFCCAVLVACFAVVSYFAAPFARRVARIPRQLVPPKSKQSNALRIGVLGATQIAPPALIWPTWKVTDAVVMAVAARTRQRAEEFALKYEIPKVHDTYEALIQDPELDAIYNPLPNGLHKEWTIRALRAGKHVLCEKPLASNRRDAEEMRNASLASERVLMEAFHYRFHPLAQRMESIVRSGNLGRIHRIETEGQLPALFVSDDDIRFSNRGTDLKLVGGALMDVGSYAVNCFRMLVAAAGQHLVKVVNATATEKFPQVDMSVTADVAAGDIHGSITASMNLPWQHVFRARARVYGDLGEMYVENFIAPFAYHYLQLRLGNNSAVTEKHYDDEHRTSYEFQLTAFAKAVADGSYREVAGSADDGVENMALIDAIYTAAGLEPRQGY